MGNGERKLITDIPSLEVSAAASEGPINKQATQEDSFPHMMTHSLHLKEEVKNMYKEMGSWHQHH